MVGNNNDVIVSELTNEAVKVNCPPLYLLQLLKAHNYWYLGFNRDIKDFLVYDSL